MRDLFVKQAPATTTADMAAPKAAAVGALEVFKALERKHGANLQLLRVVVRAAQGTPDGWEAALAGVRPERVAVAQALTYRLASNPALARKVAIALQRRDDAAADAKALVALLDKPAHLAGFPLPKFKGKLYALTTLDALFQDEPILAQMFPARAVTTAPRFTSAA